MKLENTENPPSEEARVEVAEDSKIQNELHEPCWSVVSFEKREAANLTYQQAADKLAELAAQKVSGLCIITDEAAARILSEPAA